MKNTEDARLRTEFSDRLNQALDEMGHPKKNKGRQTAAAKLFGYTQKGVRRWLEAEGFPRPKQIDKICRLLNVRKEWLMFGLGPMRPAGEAFDQVFMQKILVCVQKAVKKASIPVTEQQQATLVTTLYDALRQE